MLSKTKAETETHRDENADHESDDRIREQLRLREESGQVPASQDPEGAAEEGERADEHVERDQDAEGADHRDPDPLHQRNLVDLHLESLCFTSGTEEKCDEEWLVEFCFAKKLFWSSVVQYFFRLLSRRGN